MLTLERTTPRPAAPGPLAPKALHALQWVAARRPVAGFMGPTRDVAHAVSTTLAADSSIDPQVLRWMPVAVPLAAVLLCAGIALIWVLA